MNRRGQSTVEPMFVLTAVLLALGLFLYVREDLYTALVITIGEWVAARVQLP